MLFFVVYGCLSPHLSPKSSLRNRTKRKRIFFPCVSSLLSRQHSFLFLLWSLTFIFFPSSPSTPTSFKPWVFAPFYSRFFLCLTVELYFQLKPWSLCRCPQPGAETGAYQQPRCICHSLWCPCYVKWSGWGPASCRSKVVSTPWKDHKEAVSMIALQQQLLQFQFFPTFLTNKLMFHMYNKTGTNWRDLCIILKM